MPSELLNYIKDFQVYTGIVFSGFLLLVVYFNIGLYIKEASEDNPIVAVIVENSYGELLIGLFWPIPIALTLLFILIIVPFAIVFFLLFVVFEICTNIIGINIKRDWHSTSSLKNMFNGRILDSYLGMIDDMF